MTKQEKAIRREQMKAFKAEGHTHEEVADKFGVSIRMSYEVCGGIAPQKASNHPNYNTEFKNQYSGEDTLKLAQKYFDKQQGFEYIGGFTNCEATVTMLHTECGRKFTISMNRVRHGQINCPLCRAEAKQAIREERQAAAEEARKEKARLKEERIRIKEERRKKIEHECPECGAMTTRPKYCSNQCMARANNRTHEHKRRTLTKDGDSDITLRKLYQKEKGICYLCGGKVNYKDGYTKDGTFIAGNNYPSIEHIIPLSKGGTHSWDNVRLAHRYCNMQKRDDTPLLLNLVAQNSGTGG